MAGIDIGPRIGIDGEAQFRRELSQINQSLKTLDSEGKLLTATMEKETDAEKKSAAQKDLLERKMLTQKEAVEQIQKALTFSAQAYGESDERTLRWQRSLNEATATLRTMENQLDGADDSVEEISDDMQGAEKDTKGWADVLKGSLLSSAITGGFKMLKDAAKAAAESIKDAALAGASYADDILTLSTTTRLSTETLQEFKYMEDLIDVSLDTVTGSLSKMTKNMTSARKGTGDAAEAWKKLGVRIEDDNKQLRRSEDVFRDTITALGKIKNETERDTVAMALFGKSAQELNPLIEAGGEKLATLAKEAHDTGYVLSGATLNSLGQVQDAMDRMNKRSEALTNRFSAGLAPSLTKVADIVDETLASPRVRRGIDDAAKAIGGMIEGVVNLGVKALPGLLDILGLVDPALRYLTDEQLEFIERTNELTASWNDAKASFADSAGTILTQTQNTQALWKELQTLTTETGYVRDADKERAEYILGQLSEALGTEYTLTGNQIGRYQEMTETINKMIEAKEAEALLSAFQEKNTAAVEEYGQAMSDVLENEEAYRDAIAKREAADRAVADAEAQVAAATKKSAIEQDAAQRALEAANDAQEAAYKQTKEIIKTYEEADAVVDELSGTMETYRKATEAMYKGNYAEVIAYTTKSADLERRNLEQKKVWNQEDLAAYKTLQEQKVAEWQRAQRKLEEGNENYSKEQVARILKEAEDMASVYVSQRISMERAGKEVGEALGTGMEKGLESAGARVEAKARRQMQNAIKAMKYEAQIASPSKVTTQFGEYLDLGLIRGMGNRESEAERKAREVMRSTMAGFAGAGPSTALPYTTALSGAYRPSYDGGSTTNNYSTSMGGITVNVNGANVDNVQQLAGLVAVELNDQLLRTRAARGAWA